MKFSERDFLELAFSTSSRILDAVDSPNCFVVLIFTTPEIFIQPLETSSSARTSRGTLSPVNAEVFNVVVPSTIIPSRGIFSPGFTTITEPIATVSGSTVSVSPFSLTRFA